MTEKLILITLMHENTPYFLIFPFFEIFRGAFAPLPLYGTAPELKNYTFFKYVVSWIDVLVIYLISFQILWLNMKI